jgi:hypothetical protein
MAQRDQRGMTTVRAPAYSDRNASSCQCRSEPCPQPTPNPSDPAGGFPDNARIGAQPELAPIMAPEVMNCIPLSGAR